MGTADAWRPEVNMEKTVSHRKREVNKRDKNRTGRNLGSRSNDRLFSFTVRKGGNRNERIEAQTFKHGAAAAGGMAVVSVHSVRQGDDPAGRYMNIITCLIIYLHLLYICTIHNLTHYWYCPIRGRCSVINSESTYTWVGKPNRFK